MASPPERPPVVFRATVEPAWIDRNGHFNAGYYVVVFDTALVPWFDTFGLTSEYRQRHGVTTFTAESHVTYLREVREGASLAISAQLLGHDRKRIHSFLRMHHAADGFLAATYEVLSLFVDARARRVAAMPDEVSARLERTGREHSVLPQPSQAGRRIAIDAAPPARDGDPAT
jgi:acyl-CoA thioester hydrolase